MAESRVGNSVRNVFAAWGGQAIYAICSFLVRATLIATLPEVFVGLESLFASLLTILSLADLGVGAAIVFALYEPLAHDDRESVKSIMRLFKRAYITIGIVIIAIGAIITPNIAVLLGADAPDIEHLQVYFFCFVLNTGVSYFFSYKGSLIMADQKSYIVYIIQYAFQIVMALAQIAVLLLTHNYLLFLVCMVSSTLFQNIVIAHRSNKMYPYLKEKDVKPIDREVLSGIKKNVAGMMMHKLAGVASTPASNLIITLFVGISTTALYGNYLLVTGALERIIIKVFDSIVASVGNLSAKESEDRQYEVFQTTFFINAMLYAMVSIGLLCCVNHFIDILATPDWRMDTVTVFLIVLLFYVKGMREAGITFTSAYGLYWLTKWKAVLEAVGMPLLALVLVRPLGINGVLLAGIISSLGISTIYEAWAVYSHGFHKPLRRYPVMFMRYAAVTIACAALAWWICSFITLPAIAAFIVCGAIGMLTPTVVFTVLFGRGREFKEMTGIMRSISGRVLKKLRR